MNNKIKEILLIITLAFAFSEYLGDSLTRISDSITYSCLLFWIVAAVIKYVVTKKSSCLNTEKNIVMNGYYLCVYIDIDFFRNYGKQIFLNKYSNIYQWVLSRCNYLYFWKKSIKV